MKPTRSKWRQRLFTVGFMVLVTVCCITPISVLHVASQARVQQNAALYVKRSIMQAALGQEPGDAATVLAWYERHVRQRDSGDAYTILDDDGREQGMVAVRRGAGLWGTIVAAIGLTADGRAFTGLAVIEHNETPGLGARIDEPWFWQQVTGKTGGLELVPEGTQPARTDRLDAITGATVTSTAIRDMLNRLVAERGDVGAAETDRGT